MGALMDRMSGWVWIGLFLLGALGVAFLWQVARFLAKRVSLLTKLAVDCRRGSIRLKPRRPLWWLAGPRCGYDLLVELRDPATGAVTHTLAVKLISTLRQRTEYSIGDMDHWEAKTNYLMPTGRGVMMFDLGYRRCLPRPVDRVFRWAPPGVIRVYLFHPHPHALTLGRRGDDRREASRGVTELGVPLWREGVLLLDLDSLRRLAGAQPDARGAMLSPHAM